MKKFTGKLIVCEGGSMMSRYKVTISGINTSELTVLNNKEMKELFLKLQSGDQTAKETLINGNLKLVLSIVQRFSSRCENMDDLFQVGCIGLVKSIAFSKSPQASPTVMASYFPKERR